MKLSLRNLALTGALFVAGAAAAATPTVKLDWEKSFSSAELTYNIARYAYGVNDKFYFTDNANGQIKVYDHATDYLTKYCDAPGLAGVALTGDDAGNLMYQRGWAGATAETNYSIVSAADKSVTDLTITMPDNIAPGRMDFMGRVVGDMLSEEGAIFYALGEKGTNIIMLNIVNGEQNKDNFKFYSSETIPVAGGSNAVCQPMYTYEELLDMGDDAVNACAFRQRAYKWVYTYDGSDWGTLPLDETQGFKANTSDAFDVFSLDGVDYYIIPGNASGGYSNLFAIADFEGNILYIDERKESVDGYKNGSSIFAHKIDENTVEVYVFYPNNAATTAYVAKYTVSIPSAPAEAPLYACGTINDWSPENAVEMAFADGKWTLDLGATSNADFKISTTKGPWDNADAPEQSFNYGVLGLADVDTALPFNTPMPLIPGKKGNITISGKGTYKVEVTKEGENYTIVLAGEMDPIEAPEAEEIFIRGEFNGWGATPEYQFVDCGTQGVFRKYTCYVAEPISGLFKIGDASANWTKVNFGLTEGAAVTIDLEYPLVQNGRDIKADNLENLTFVLMHSGDPAQASTLQLFKGNVGVDGIEVEEENAPATYYNLQGVEVNAENLNAGVYVKVAGGKATKVLVK